VEAVGDGRAVVGEPAEARELVGDDGVVEVVVLEQPEVGDRAAREMIEKRCRDEEGRKVGDGAANER